MRHFMAGFFLVFSFFKFLDTSGFASAFRMYDQPIKASSLGAIVHVGWSWIYPYVELLLGESKVYLLSWQPLATECCHSRSDVCSVTGGRDAIAFLL